MEWAQENMLLGLARETNNNHVKVHDPKSIIQRSADMEK